VIALISVVITFAIIYAIVEEERMINREEKNNIEDE